ncbi:amidohydrolase family protein [Microbacterium sp. 5K110]|uniref:amidohydrolase family protein n=1 Tax=unclassified Microbacterium TaxID=2609290 RepID=UPI00339BFC55
MPLGAAIDAYTRGSATLLGVGTGLLRIGERADLAVADRDPFAGPAEALHETRTALTVLGGAVIAS